MLVLQVASGDESARQIGQHADHPLGTVHFPISCSAQAQVRFDHATALLHHMTYPQARAAFEQVAATEPQCAMAYWGIAMTLFQPLWPTRPGPDDLRRGWEAVQRAEALQPPTERERLFVAAAAAFFRDPRSEDYWGRIERWEEAMQQTYAAFPRDPEVAAFHALALLAVVPADRITHENADQAAAILLDIYRRNPDHPGAMHYLVHANDTPGREHELLDIVRRYETVAPRNPHALHMPTHIYTRIGDWDAVIAGNLRAAEAALEYPAGEQGQFVWDEFPHAIEYLIYAYLQQGDDEDARTQLQRLNGTAHLEPSFKTAFHTASTRARYALERRDWSEAMSLAPRDPATLDWDRFPWPEGVTWFARGLGAVHLGEFAKAQQASQRLAQLEAAARTAGEELFARNLRVLRLEVDAWLAHASHENEKGVALMREAAELEATTPKHAVTPAPTLPGYELLGDLLLEQGRADEALEAYERSSALYPRRFNSFLGAARAARTSGDASRARGYYGQLLSTASGSTRAAVLREAQEYVAGGLE